VFFFRQAESWERAARYNCLDDTAMTMARVANEKLASNFSEDGVKKMHARCVSGGRQ
jgi:hypothetical protein